jgi:hypothetical protein
MSKKPKISKKTLTVILACVCVAVIAGVSVGVMTYYSGPSTPAQNTNVPNLVTSNMQYLDNRTDTSAPFFHVTGIITNNGNATANNCTLHMVAIQNGNATAIDQTITIESIAEGATQTFTHDFNYTGTAIVAYNSPTLDWTN